MNWISWSWTSRGLPYFKIISDVYITRDWSHFLPAKLMCTELCLRKIWHFVYFFLWAPALRLWRPCSKFLWILWLDVKNFITFFLRYVFHSVPFIIFSDSQIDSWMWSIHQSPAIAMRNRRQAQSWDDIFCWERTADQITTWQFIIIIDNRKKRRSISKNIFKEIAFD